MLYVITTFQQSNHSEGDAGDLLVESTLSIYGAKATQSGQYQCEYNFVFEGSTFPIQSEAASVVVQGWLS